MNRIRRAGALVLLAAACTGGICALAHRTSTGAQTVAASTTKAEGPRVRWPAGSELRYRLSWHTESALHVMPGAAVEGHMDSGGASALEGTLVLKVARATEHGATLLASFDELTTARFVVRGQPDAIPEDTARDALVGATAVLEVDDRGHLVRVRAPKDANPMFADVMHALATQLSFELAEDDAIGWTSEERTMTGTSRSSYRFDTTADGVVVERKLEGYARIHALRSQPDQKQDVEGGARIRLDGAGTLTSFEAGERVRVEAHGATIFESSTNLSAVLASRAPFAFSGDAEIAGFEVHEHGKGTDPHAADRSLSGDFAREDLLALVAGYAASGSFGRGQLARAAAFLRLHPEELKTLETTFDKQASARGKSVVFDLLSSAGSAEAQTAMRRLLETPHAKTDAALHRMLVQRFALLGKPTAESIAYLRDLERRASAGGDGALARAALVSRGSALARRMAAGDPDARSEARALLSQVRGDLSSMPADDRAALVKAVGNLRHPDAASALSALAKDESPDVRASVASALRRSRTGDGPRLLLDMMGDPDPYVARTAVESYLDRRLDAKELGAFAEHLRATATSPEVDAAVATVVLQHAETDRESVRSILEVLLSRAPEDSEDAVRLRTALASLSA